MSGTRPSAYCPCWFSLAVYPNGRACERLAVPLALVAGGRADDFQAQLAHGEVLCGRLNSAFHLRCYGTPNIYHPVVSFYLLYRAVCFHDLCRRRCIERRAGDWAGEIRTFR